MVGFRRNLVEPEMGMNQLPRYRLLARNFPVLPSVRTTLWQGDDHILHVRHGTTDDRYHRFYFKDIQHIAIYRTSRGLVQSSILALTAIAALLAALTVSSFGFRVFWATIGCLCLWWLVRCAVGGHSCACWIQTAVGETRLSAPARMRQAERMTKRLHPLIETAQASLEPQMSTGSGSVVQVAAETLPPPLPVRFDASTGGPVAATGESSRLSSRGVME